MHGYVTCLSSRAICLLDSPLQRDSISSRRVMAQLEAILGQQRMYLAFEADVLPLCDFVAAMDGDLEMLVDRALQKL